MIQVGTLQRPAVTSCLVGGRTVEAMDEHAVSAKLAGQLNRLERLHCTIRWFKAGPGSDRPEIHTCKVTIPDGRVVLGRGVSRDEAARAAIRVVEKVLH
jgi:hypothetical protein